MLNYAIEGIVGFSTAPFRLATYLGMFAALGAIIYSFAVIIQKLFGGIVIPGYATMIVLLFFSSMQLFCIGIIGEYVGRTFEQSKNHPIYIAKEVLDFEEEGSI